MLKRYEQLNTSSVFNTVLPEVKQCSAANLSSPSEN